ncbi:MAG: 2-amino-4-hydroxy-6-hydroxymethyldihydropteridine pyrophosphokinase, partial [Campylobacter sp.]|nr:2-amino-4-hydroxy-6-hydroxymethyldihydropteridine pyrophosphokinase [Campylobacter sp.]
MQGKILSPQLISGDDGKRYEYDKNDVVNLGDKDLAMLTGSQVDFVSFDERVAKSIYIIAENVNVSSILSADSISSARLKALWGLGLQFFNFIPYIGQIIAIVGFVLYSMAIY